MRSDVEKVERSSPAKRGRPRDFNRLHALEAAMRLFWSQGYASTAISDLTATMGIGVTSLYAAFGSKEELYIEALNHYLSLYEARVWARFQSAETAQEAFAALLSDTADFVARAADSQNPLGCMTTQWVVGDNPGSKLALLMQSRRSDMFDKVRSRLSRAVENGEVCANLDLDALARFFLTLLNGMAVQARAGASLHELQEAATITMAGWHAWTR